MTMSAPDPVRIDRADGVLSIALARPDKRNALNAALVERLIAVVTNAYEDGTHLLVLKGEGKNFSAGFDFTAVAAESEGDLLLRFVRIEVLLQAVYHAPFETVAFADGRNFGAGVDLFCACARRFAAPGATFRMPGLQFGIVLGTRRLAEVLGEANARAVLWSSETFDAAKALDMDFIEAMAECADWKAIQDRITASEHALDATAIRALCERTRTDSRAEDLYSLVRSASRPGIKDRIRAYLNPPLPHQAGARQGL